MGSYFSCSASQGKPVVSCSNAYSYFVILFCLPHPSPHPPRSIGGGRVHLSHSTAISENGQCCMEVYSAGVFSWSDRSRPQTPAHTHTHSIHIYNSQYPQIHIHPHISTDPHIPTHIHTQSHTYTHSSSHTHSLYSSLFLPPFPSLNIRSTDSAHHGARSGNDSYNAADNDRPERGDAAYPRPGRQSTVLGPAAEM